MEMFMYGFLCGLLLMFVIHMLIAHEYGKALHEMRKNWKADLTYYREDAIRTAKERNYYFARAQMYENAYGELPASSWNPQQGEDAT